MVGNLRTVQFSSTDHRLSKCRVQLSEVKLCFFPETGLNGHTKVRMLFNCSLISFFRKKCLIQI